MVIRLFLACYFLCFSLFGKPVETFYGIVEVDEPVLIELIESPTFQRLKHIHQYGVSYYTTHTEEFTRYAHSLGVFHLLRKNGRSLNEQIAGLLHDVSHTVFSHVGDWVFNKEHMDIDYQDSIHERFLEKTGLGAILRKHGITPKEVLPIEKIAPALEQPRPNPSADRLDYSIQGAYHQNFITKEEALEIFNDCHFVNNRWVATKKDLMTKMVRFTLFMTEDCFGSATNHLAARWLADAILKAFETGLVTSEEFHIGTDDVVWSKLVTSNDPYIKSCMHKVFNAKKLYLLVDPKDADTIISTKFWGFDPWILHNNEVVRLTSINKNLEKDYHIVKERISLGFAIKLFTQEKATLKSS